MCGSGAPDDADQNGRTIPTRGMMRDDPAEHGGLSIVAGYRRHFARGRQGFHRMQNQEQADHPVRDPARIVEHGGEDDEIARAHQQQRGDHDAAMHLDRKRADRAGKIAPERRMQPDQQRVHGNAEQVRGHALPGIVDFLGQRLVPDIAETQQIGSRGVDHAALQIMHERVRRHRHGAVELRGGEQQADAENRCRADRQVDRLRPATR